jgi:DNA topoisomerase-1
LKKDKADKKKLDAQKKKIDDFTTKMKLAEKLAGVALGTSRLNYIDPRITLAWCKEAQFDFKRLFPKTQQARAMTCDCCALRSCVGATERA